MTKTLKAQKGTLPSSWTNGRHLIPKTEPTETSKSPYSAVWGILTTSAQICSKFMEVKGLQPIFRVIAFLFHFLNAGNWFHLETWGERASISGMNYTFPDICQQDVVYALSQRLAEMRRRPCLKGNGCLPLLPTTCQIRPSFVGCG